MPLSVDTKTERFYTSLAGVAALSQQLAVYAENVMVAPGPGICRSWPGVSGLAHRGTVHPVCCSISGHGGESFGSSC